MWKLFNNLAYRLYFAYRGRRSRSVARAWPSRLPTAASGEPRLQPVLYVAWGRIGDLVLSTGHLQRLRRWFHPHPVWFLGRSQVKPVVEPFVDEFLAVPESSDPGSAPGAASDVRRTFRYVIADVHTFNGGLFALGPMLSALRADRKFIYEGFHLGPDLAPERPYPAGFEIIPMYRPDGTSAAVSDWTHVLDHNTHYIREVLERCGIESGSCEPWRPVLDHIGPGKEDCRRFGLEPGGFVAWQPFSDNRRKDLPLSHWAAVMRAFPDHHFVALAEPGKAVPLNRLESANVRVVEANLSLAMRLIGEARLFIGLDSGLSHIAAALGRPTVCVCPDSHLGYFFPYPEDYGYGNLHTVFNPDYLACRGCFMTCRHEPLTRTVSRGALCLRTLPVRSVIDAIGGALQVGD